MSMRAVWQLAGGPTNRSFSDVFIEYGVGLLGPGDPGSWSPQRPDTLLQGCYVRRFASALQEGDVLLLRTGASTIRAVGVVASEYQYLEQFDDVNGWDLQHARRVRWYPLPNPEEFEGKVFGANPPRFSRVWSKEVVEYAHRFIHSSPTNWQLSPLPPLPDVEPPLEDIQPNIRNLVAIARDLVPMYWDRMNFGDIPSEHEMVAHFVVPLLLSFGWSHELIAVEWQRIDVAVFRRLPRVPENCAFIIEAKRFDTGIDGALQQAQGYFQKLGGPRDILVTDGIRYRLCSAEKDFQSIAYANLLRLKQSATGLFKYLQKQTEGV